MYDIPLDNTPGSVNHTTTQLPPPRSHRQRTTPTRPRLPSPDLSSQADTSYDQSVETMTPPPLPKRHSNERLSSDTPQQDAADAGYDRGRERRPLGNIDPMTFAEQLRTSSYNNTPPGLTSQNQMSYGPADRDQKQMLRQSSSNQVRDRLQQLESPSQGGTGYEQENVPINQRQQFEPALPLKAAQHFARDSGGDSKRAKLTNYDEQQQPVAYAAAQPYTKRRHRSGRDDDKPSDAPRTTTWHNYPQENKHGHAMPAAAPSEYKAISLIRPRVLSLDNVLSSKFSLPAPQHARSNSMEEPEKYSVNFSTEEVIIEPPYECSTVVASSMSSAVVPGPSTVRSTGRAPHHSHTLPKPAKPPKPPKPSNTAASSVVIRKTSASRGAPSAPPPSTNHNRSASMEGMYQYRTDPLGDGQSTAHVTMTSSRLRFKSEEPVRSQRLSDSPAQPMGGATASSKGSRSGEIVALSLCRRLMLALLHRGFFPSISFHLSTFLLGFV